jgi:hypothetical protein
MSDAAPCSTEPFDENECCSEPPTEEAIEMRALVDGLERDVCNIRVLSADMRTHIEARFDRLRKLLPAI